MPKLCGGYHCFSLHLTGSQKFTRKHDADLDSVVQQVFGPESSGKTTLALHAMAAVQKAGGTALLVDAEHAFDAQYSKVSSPVQGVHIHRRPISHALSCCSNVSSCRACLGHPYMQGSLQAFMQC